MASSRKEETFSRRQFPLLYLYNEQAKKGQINGRQINIYASLYADATTEEECQEHAETVCLAIVPYLVRRITNYSLPPTVATDCLSEMMIGVLKALQTFDPYSGLFISYVQGFLLESLTTVMNRNHEVYIPKQVRNRIRQEALLPELEPGAYDYTCSDKSKLFVHQVASDYIGRDYHFTKANESHYVELLGDIPGGLAVRHNENVCEEVQRSEVFDQIDFVDHRTDPEQLEKSLDTVTLARLLEEAPLTDLERDTMNLMLRGHTLEEVAAIIKKGTKSKTCTKEYVFQLKDKAIAKLRRLLQRNDIELNGGVVDYHLLSQALYF